MSMLEKFFSLDYAGRSDLFEGLSVWQSEQYRNLQGSYPVILLSFANVKETSFKKVRKKICYIIERLYNRYEFLLEDTFLNEKEKQFYADSFGFTEEEVFAALEEFGFSEERQQVKDWYDGFTFGIREDIYNPWSVINFLSKGKTGTYWANTSSNSLVDKLLREGRVNVKQTFEELLSGGKIHHMEIDEQIVYNQLPTKKNAIWSLLLASGYLKVVSTAIDERTGNRYYDLALTNREVHIMFEHMIQDWFSGNDNYNDFIRALMLDDVKAMNVYMNRVALEMFSYFDTGKNVSEAEPERFYHGFVLGLMVELSDRYTLTSNRESGFGKYDVMLEPKENVNDAIIMEFKVQEAEEKELFDTVQDALRQIETKKYEAILTAKGIPRERIRKYGFAFCGKRVLIGSAGGCY